MEVYLRFISEQEKYGITLLDLTDGDDDEGLVPMRFYVHTGILVSFV
jgi:hypothetical protein